MLFKAGQTIVGKGEGRRRILGNRVIILVKVESQLFRPRKDAFAEPNEFHWLATIQYFVKDDIYDWFYNKNRNHVERVRVYKDVEENRKYYQINTLLTAAVEHLNICMMRSTNFSRTERAASLAKYSRFIAIVRAKQFMQRVGRFN